MKDKALQLQTILNTSIDRKTIMGTSFALKSDDFIWSGAAGDLKKEQPYFIASTTKLFTSAILLQLLSEDKLNLEDKILKYIEPEILKGLHTYKGKDYTHELNIEHLLAHTSGLPDYFQDKSLSGMSLEKELIKGKDQKWTFEQIISKTKMLKPHFPPGVKNKAHYSDTNYQLLGKIIENITDLPYAENLSVRIIKPLHLTKTYLYQDPQDTTPKHLYYKNQILHVPKAMTSFGPDGGIVSNSGDMLQFIEAYFNGNLFPITLIPKLRTPYPYLNNNILHGFVAE